MLLCGHRLKVENCDIMQQNSEVLVVHSLLNNKSNCFHFFIGSYL